MDHRRPLLCSLRAALKWTGLTLFGLAILITGCLLYVNWSGIPKYDVQLPNFEAETTPQNVERGKKLAKLMCATCHENPTTHRFTGHEMTDLPSAFGKVFSANITRDPKRGIGSWSDAELAYLLRTGIRRDGQYLPPWMIKVPHLSDADLSALIAYLRSDDAAVAPTDVPPSGQNRPSLLSKVLTHTIMKPLPYPRQPIVAPNPTDRVAYGRYLTFALDCFGCHSGDFKQVDPLQPERSAGYMGGGTMLIGADGREIASANLTPDESTGIGRWREEDFVRALRQGVRPDGRALRYPMLPKPELTQDEAAAIYAYLRTIPKLNNRVVSPVEQAAAASEPGKRLYSQYGCNGCHGNKGEGTTGVPDLNHVNDHFPDDATLRAWIESPQTTKPETKMPTWKGIIKDEDYAPLIGYLRSLNTGDGKVALTH